jgi:hypothetical protein
MSSVMDAEHDRPESQGALSCMEFMPQHRPHHGFMTCKNTVHGIDRTWTRWGMSAEVLKDGPV